MREAMFLSRSSSMRGGRIVSEGQGMPAALIRRNFLFCLEPSCGVAYTRNQRSERAKLATLGVDNRSTATTILAVRSLIELQGDRDLQPEARKLLSFTDNRQDASLQAGHFNDFAQVALLRSALHKATQAKGTTGLEPRRAVAQRLRGHAAAVRGLRRRPGGARTGQERHPRRAAPRHRLLPLPRPAARLARHRAESRRLRPAGVRLRGLRGDEGLLGETALWEDGLLSPVRVATRKQFIETPAAVRSCPPEVREEVLRTLLDVLRRDLAVKVDVLDPQKQLDLVEQTQPRLLEDTVWYLEDARELDQDRSWPIPDPGNASRTARDSSCRPTAATAAI